MRNPSTVARHPDSGMVTAEAAVAVPSLLVVLALVLSAVITVGAKLQVLDASREAARFAARGETTSDAVRAGKQLAPRGASVTVHEQDTWVEARVSVAVQPFTVGPAITVHATTYAEREDR